MESDMVKTTTKKVIRKFLPFRGTGVGPHSGLHWHCKLECSIFICLVTYFVEGISLMTMLIILMRCLLKGQKHRHHVVSATGSTAAADVAKVAWYNQRRQYRGLVHDERSSFCRETIEAWLPLSPIH